MYMLYATNSSKFVEICFMAQVMVHLGKYVPWALEKNVYSVIVGLNVL